MSIAGSKGELGEDPIDQSCIDDAGVQAIAENRFGDYRWSGARATTFAITPWNVTYNDNSSRYEVSSSTNSAGSAETLDQGLACR